MGVYSNLASQRVNEASMLETFKYTDLLEYAINIEKSNQAMFDAMLEMDFHEAYAAKGLIVVNETEEGGGVKAAVKKIIAKIIEALKKFVSVIKTFWAKLRNHLSDLTGYNKKLIDKIEKKGGLSKDKVLAGIGDKKISITVVNSKKYYDSVAEYFKDVEPIIDQEHFKVDEVKSTIDGVVESIGKLDDLFTKKDLKEAINDGSVVVEKLKDLVAEPYGDQIKSLEQKFDVIIKKCNAKAENLDKKLKGADVSDDDRALYNDDIKAINALISGSYKFMNICKSFVARSCASYRSLYAKCGSLIGSGEKAAEGEKANVENPPAVIKQESTELDYQLNTIDIVNEIFIEDLFS